MADSALPRHVFQHVMKFKVHNFSDYHMESGQYLLGKTVCNADSSTETAHLLQVYPRGIDGDSKDYVSLQVTTFKPKVRIHKMNYHICIIREETCQLILHTSGEIAGPTITLPKPIPLKILLTSENGYRIDCLIVVVSLLTTEEEKLIPASGFTDSDPQLLCLQDFFKGQTAPSVAVYVEAGCCGHRVTPEEQDREQIRRMTVGELHQFLHQDHGSVRLVNVKSLIDVLSTAVVLGVVEVKLYCARELARRIDKENVLEILWCALMHHLTNLRVDCIWFLCDDEKMVSFEVIANGNDGGDLLGRTG